MNESTRNKFISKRNEREKRKEKREKRERERKGRSQAALEREREVRAGARRHGNRRDKNNSARVRLPCNKETER